MIIIVSIMKRATVGHHICTITLGLLETFLFRRFLNGHFTDVAVEIMLIIEATLSMKAMSIAKLFRPRASRLSSAVTTTKLYFLCSMVMKRTISLHIMPIFASLENFPNLPATPIENGILTKRHVGRLRHFFAVVGV